MLEYDFYIPLFDNRRRRISRQRLTNLKRKLTEEFGGLTYFPQRNEGRWKVGGATFRDEIVILRVLAESSARTRRMVRSLKIAIERDWKQTELLVIARVVKVV